MRVAALLLTLAAAMLTAAAPARAELGPIRLVSKDSEEQAQEASATAISKNGRYLAFQAAIGGLKGVFREDLESGGLTAVEVGNAYEKAATGSDASAPSISADGRYVSFTTDAQLDPVDDTQPSSKDVYVADMSTSPPTYELASALDGSSQGLTYGEPGGSEASGRVALSADGRRVVFVTRAPSDLTSGPGGSTEGEPTPAGQIVLRNLDSLETTLVSVERDPESGAMTDLPVVGGAVVAVSGLPLPGAAISGDGTTVAWLGGHLPAQVPLLNDERERIIGLDGVQPYDEPLWRRVADGPGAPTRRMVGGGDPLAPGCPPDGTLADPSCQGPFPELIEKPPFLTATGWLVRDVDGTPQLSFDGRTAALTGTPTEATATNLFLVDMSPGLSRRQAVHQLTRQIPLSSDPIEEAVQINRDKYIPLNGDIFDLGLSADGNRIAIATARQQFPLAPPNLISSPPASVGGVELYLISRDVETIERVTHGIGGDSEPSIGSRSAEGGDGASSPTLDSDGSTIGFASTAFNLVDGDGNDAGDAFVVDDPQEPAATGSQEDPPPPRRIRTRRHWRFTLSASSLPNGAVRLVAVVPGRGRLRATATASLSSGRQPRLLASAARPAKVGEGGPVKLDLKLPPRLSHLARTTEGVYAMASVTFRTSKGKTLHGRLQIRFHRHRGNHGGRR